MKIIKVFLAFFLFVNLIGCTVNNNKQETKSKSIPTTKKPQKMVNYQYPDEFFNRNFSSDEQGNCYFLAGNYFYQLDTQNNLKQIFFRLIGNKYIYHAKYYNGKIYCLILNLDHTNDAPLGLASIDLDGNNFQYFNDLIYSGEYINGIVNFRIMNNNIYIYDLHKTIYYIYSLEHQAIVASKEEDMAEKRYKFYKKNYSDFPYKKIDHIYNDNLYTVITSKNKDRAIIQYNVENKKEKEINLQKYTDSEDYKVGFYVDLIDNHWFLFSSKGVFKFDQNFENVQHLLDESIFENNQLW